MVERMTWALAVLVRIVSREELGHERWALGPQATISISSNVSKVKKCSNLHWGQGPLETGRNMSGTLKGEEPFTWHVSTRHISGTRVMFLLHFPYM